MRDTAPQRLLGPMLLLGLLTVPLLFCWLLLREGYDPALRRAAFWFAAVMTAIPLVGRLAS